MFLVSAWTRQTVSIDTTSSSTRPDISFMTDAAANKDLKPQPSTLNICLSISDHIIYLLGSSSRLSAQAQQATTSLHVSVAYLDWRT